jgi:hypothetical protein
MSPRGVNETDECASGQIAICSLIAQNAKQHGECTDLNLPKKLKLTYLGDIRSLTFDDRSFSV